MAVSALLSGVHFSPGRLERGGFRRFGCRMLQNIDATSNGRSNFTPLRSHSVQTTWPATSTRSRRNTTRVFGVSAGPKRRLPPREMFVRVAQSDLPGSATVVASSTLRRSLCRRSNALITVPVPALCETESTLESTNLRSFFHRRAIMEQLSRKGAGTRRTA
jgi:hypothetical protein